MIITTAGRATSELVSKAKKLSNSYGLQYKERNGVSVEAFKAKYQDDIVIVGKNRIYISPLNNESHLFFHPNIAMIRAKRIFKGKEDTFIQTAKLKEGMSILDCTLGLASDSIIASLVVGDQGSVTGVEGNQLVNLLTREGLMTFSSGLKNFDQAMRRIQVVHAEHYSYLQHAETDSVDVVYFDPMFDTSIEESSGINGIRGQAVITDISSQVIAEAKRVAKERVMIKDHWKSPRFSRLGFTQHKRKTSLFHYGTIEI